MYIRRALDRGYSYIHDGEIESHHTFSFSSYLDKKHTGVSILKVLNDDLIKPGKGYKCQSHHDMEILTYVTSGSLEYTDDLGHNEVVDSGHIQLISSGTGVVNSEFNTSDKENVKLLEMWIEPSKKGCNPCYQTTFVPSHDGLKLVASPDISANGHIHIRQDVKIYIGHQATGSEIIYEIPKGRKIWLQMIKGEAGLDDSLWDKEQIHLYEGDGLGLRDEHAKLHIHATSGAEFLLFDLPADDSDGVL